jgi:hypothetical protein
MKTDDEKRIAIAKFCPEVFGYTESGEIVFILWRKNFDQVDPLNDLNAMHEAEENLKPDQFSCYLQWLTDAVSSECRFEVENRFAVCHATARQRADALLKTLNLLG